MARYEHLPIYRKAFDMSVYFENIVKNFSRYHKYTVGTELREYARMTVKLIIRANNAREKQVHLLQLRQLLEEMKVTLRLCKEVKAFNNFKSFEVAVNQVIDISRQNEGWLRSLSPR